MPSIISGDSKISIRPVWWLTITLTGSINDSTFNLTLKSVVFGSLSSIVKLKSPVIAPASLSSFWRPALSISNLPGVPLTAVKAPPSWTSPKPLEPVANNLIASTWTFVSATVTVTLFVTWSIDAKIGASNVPVPVRTKGSTSSREVVANVILNPVAPSKSACESSVFNEEISIL